MGCLQGDRLRVRAVILSKSTSPFADAVTILSISATARAFTNFFFSTV